MTHIDYNRRAEIVAAHCDHPQEAAVCEACVVEALQDAVESPTIMEAANKLAADASETSRRLCGAPWGVATCDLPTGHAGPHEFDVGIDEAGNLLPIGQHARFAWTDAHNSSDLDPSGPRCICQYCNCRRVIDGPGVCYLCAWDRHYPDEHAVLRNRREENAS